MYLYLLSLCFHQEYLDVWLMSIFIKIREANLIHAQFVAYFWAMQHIRKATDAMILLPGAFMSQWMLHVLKMSFSFKHHVPFLLFRGVAWWRAEQKQWGKLAIFCKHRHEDTSIMETQPRRRKSKKWHGRWASRRNDEIENEQEPERPPLGSVFTRSYRGKDEVSNC